MPRPRIVCLAPLPPPATGQSVVTATFLNALAHVADVETVDTADREHVWRRPRTLPVGRVVAWAGRLRDFRRRLARRPDSVYMTPASSTLGLFRDVAALALVPRQVRVVAHVHMGDYGRLLTDPVVGPLARATARRYERILVPSAYAADWIRRAMPGARVQVVPNPVAPEVRFTHDEEAQARTARRGQPPHVIFLSNMIPAKGYGPLADALAVLAARGEAFRVTFVGAWATDDARDAFTARLGDLGLQDRAVVTGAVAHADLRPLLARADVIAFPSAMPESFGMGMLEAMGAGCAVVATDHAAAPEIARDGLDGRLVPPGDGPALVDALADVFARRDAYGASAARRAREAFAPEPLTAAFVRALLGEAAAGRDLVGPAVPGGDGALSFGPSATRV